MLLSLVSRLFQSVDPKKIDRGLESFLLQSYLLLVIHLPYCTVQYLLRTKALIKTSDIVNLS